MHELKPATRAFISLLLVAAVGLTTIAATRGSAPRGSQLLVAFALLLGMAAAWRFPVVFAARSKLYVDSAFTVAAVLLLPPGLAACAVGAGTLTGYALRHGAIDWPEALFNAAQVTLAALSASLLLAAVGWNAVAPSFVSPWPLLILLVVAVVTFLLNIVLIAVVTAFESASPLYRVFWSAMHEDLRFEALAHVTLVALGALIALVVTSYPWAVVLLAIPIVVTHYTLSHQTRLRLEAERARIMSDASMAEAQRLAHVGSWKWYPGNNRWVWSDETYRIYGVAPGATFPTLDDVLAIVHPAERASVQRTLSEAEKQRAAFTIEHQIRRHDGSARYVEQRGAVLPSDNGAVVLYGTVQDISERVLAEQTIRAAARAAEEADRAKSRLLTMASHDLRTPLTAIQGYIEMVIGGSAGEIGAEQRELLDIAHRNAVELGALINDLLDLARIEAGGLKLRIGEVNVRLSVEHVINTLSPLATEKGIRLASSFEYSSISAAADPARLNQILLNLVGNAVKFTEEGSVTVRAWADGDLVAIEVSDTGCGIAPEALPHIFEEFNQAGEAARRKGGAGLGLAIVKQLVNLHKGSIEVESTPGVGTTFLVRLPTVGLPED